MRFTVFTPTYNRAHTLERLYQSLQEQSFQEFEWIVVDDGSTDNTEALLLDWAKDNSRKFSIIYKKVKNGGKHRAINYALEIAMGELFFIVDSDDYLLPKSLEIVDRVEKSIPLNLKKKFAGICGQDIYTNGSLVGSTYIGDQYLDISYLDSGKYGITGDKKEIFYTDILRQFPFPEFENEKFICEGLVLGRIAKAGYKLRYFNEPIYIVEYQSTGISNNLDEIQKSSPKGWALTIKEDIECGKLSKNGRCNIMVWYYKSFIHTMDFKSICKNLGITSNQMRYYLIKNNILRVVKKVYSVFRNK